MVPQTDVCRFTFLRHDFPNANLTNVPSRVSDYISIFYLSRLSIKIKTEEKYLGIIFLSKLRQPSIEQLNISTFFTRQLLMISGTPIFFDLNSSKSEFKYDLKTETVVRRVNAL